MIAHYLAALFPQMELTERALFRVTRDADFEVSDEADDLLEAVELELRRRRFGDVVRLEVSSQMSSAMLDRLKLGLDVDDSHVYQVGGLLDLSELAQLLRVERADLRDPAWVGATPSRFAAGIANDDLFAEIRRSDQLVHHPYESFATTFEAFVRAAAKDRDVIGLKTTVYRTSDESPLVPALIEASEDGKQSVCLVELKARFDERRNIEWSRKLERAGVHVVYGYPSLKIHLKATQVVRREGDGLRRYVHIGTGNYHAYNARVYEDFGLFTADEEIAADVADLFNHLTGFGKPPPFRKILVAPYNLRERFVDEIRRVAKAAADGKPARIRIKVNALTDPANHRRALRRLRGGGARRGDRALDLLDAAGSQGAFRERSCPVRARPFPRAQPRLPLRPRRRRVLADGQRGPDAEEPRQPARARRARRERTSALAPLVGVRHAPGRQHGNLGARRGGRLAPASSHEGAARTSGAGGSDQERLPCSASSRYEAAMMSESTATIRSMRVGVVDVGSNTVRLLVARRNPCLEPLHEARAYLRLGDEIDRNGWISEAKLRETVECVRRYAKEAVAHGAHHVDVVITAPGRLAQNSDELVGALAHGAAARVRVLAAEEEALLAFAGALACVEHPPETVAVCDSGGGSTELVVGRPDSPQWVRSIDVGSLTVRRLLPDDPPGIEAVNEARAIVRERLEGVVSPFPMAAYATGGTARALRRVIGRTLEAERLEEMIGWLAKRSASEVSRKHDLDPNRAWSLLGGAIVLAEVQSRLGVPFEVARTGLREGVAAMAFAELAVA